MLRFIFICAALVGATGPIFSGVLGIDFSGSYLNLPQSAPSMVMGFSLVLLAARGKVWSNQAVNMVASCVFAAYLIQTYPSVEQVLTKGVGIIAVWAGDMWGARIGLEMLVAVSILLVALLADSARQGLFSLTIDRKQGGWFDLLWNYLVERVPETRLLERSVCDCERSPLTNYEENR